MTIAKPVFFSDLGQMSSMQNASGDNEMGFRQNSEGNFDTLIVPNILNDDVGSTLFIRGNDSSSGTPSEFNFITLSGNDDQYRTIDIEVTRNSNDKIKIDNSKGTTDGSLTDGSILFNAPLGGIGVKFNTGKLLHVGHGKMKFESTNQESESVLFTTSGGMKLDITKNLVSTITGNNEETINGQRTLIITGTTSETLYSEKTVVINSNLIETVTGNNNLHIEGDNTETIKGSSNVTVNGSSGYTLNVAEKINIVASSNGISNTGNNGTSGYFMGNAFTPSGLDGTRTLRLIIDSIHQISINISESNLGNNIINATNHINDLFNQAGHSDKIEVTNNGSVLKLTSKSVGTNSLVLLDDNNTNQVMRLFVPGPNSYSISSPASLNNLFGPGTNKRIT